MAGIRPMSRAERAAAFGIDCGGGIHWRGGTWSPGGEYSGKLTVKNVSMRMQKVRYELPKTKIFFMEFPDTLVLSSGMSVQLEVRFRPVRLTAYSDSITFTTEQGAFSVPITASLPRLAVEPPEDVAFGTVPVNETSVAPLTLRNVGEVPASIAWEVPAPFAVAPARAVLQPDSTMQVQASVLPSAAAVLQGTAVCHVTADGARSTYHVSLSATSRFQFIKLSTEVVDLGDALIRDGGKPYTTPITLSNVGPVPATVTLVPLERQATAHVKVHPEAAALPAGGSTTFTVQYTPAVHGMFTLERFQFRTPGGNAAQLTVTGRAVGPTVTLERKDPSTGTSAKGGQTSDGDVAEPLALSTTLLTAGVGQGRGGSNPLSFNFGDIDVGTSCTRVVTLRNHSKTTAFFAFDAAQGGVFDFAVAQGSVPAQLYTHVVVTFTPPSAGTFYRRVLCLVRDSTPVFADFFGSGKDATHRPMPLRQRHIDAYRLRPPPVLLLPPQHVTSIANALLARASAAAQAGDPALAGWLATTAPAAAAKPPPVGSGDGMDADFEALLGESKGVAAAPPGTREAGAAGGLSLWRLPLHLLEGDDAAAETLVQVHEAASGGGGGGGHGAGTAEAAVVGKAIRIGARAPFGLVSRTTLLQERELSLTTMGAAEVTRSGDMSRAAAALLDAHFQPQDHSTAPLALLVERVDFGHTAMGAPVTRKVRLANRTKGKMTVTWAVPRSAYAAGEAGGADFAVRPLVQDIDAESEGEFVLSFTPTADNVYFAQQLEAFVSPKPNRTFRLVDDVSLTPPVCLPLTVRGHTFSGLGQFLPRVACSLGGGHSHKVVLPTAMLGDSTHTTFQLTNEGDTPATFDFGEAGDGVWAVKPASGIIQPGAFALVTLRFTPSAPRTFTHTLTCRLNGGDTHTLTLHLLGTGGLPRLQLPRDGLVFVKPTCVGVASHATARLHNPTHLPLRYRLVLPEDAARQGVLSATPLEGELAGNAFEDVVLRFAPQAAGDHALKVGVEVFPAGRMDADWAVGQTSLDRLPTGTGYAAYAFTGGHISSGAVKVGGRVPTARLEDVSPPTEGVAPLQRLTLLVLSEGTGGALQFTPPALDFGTALVGSTLHRSVALHNISDCTLHFRVGAFVQRRGARGVPPVDARASLDGTAGVAAVDPPTADSEPDSDEEGEEPGKGAAAAAAALAATSADMGLASTSAGDALLDKASQVPLLQLDPPCGVVPAHAKVQMDVAFTPPDAAEYSFSLFYLIVSEAEVASGEAATPLLLLPGEDGSFRPLDLPAPQAAGDTPAISGPALDIAASAAAALAHAQAAAGGGAAHPAGEEGASTPPPDTQLAAGSATTLAAFDPLPIAQRGLVPPNTDPLWCHATAKGGYPSVTIEDARALCSRDALLYMFPSPPAPVAGGGSVVGGEAITLPLPPALARALALSPANRAISEEHFSAVGDMPHAVALMAAAGVDVEVQLAVTPDGTALASTALGQTGNGGLASGGAGSAVDGIPVGGNAVGGWGFFTFGPYLNVPEFEPLLAGAVRPPPPLHPIADISWTPGDVAGQRGGAMGGTAGVGGFWGPDARDVLTGVLAEHAGDSWEMDAARATDAAVLGEAGPGARSTVSSRKGVLGRPLPDAGVHVDPQPAVGSPALLWRQLSLSGLNAHLARSLTPGERSFNRATRNETAAHTLKTYTMEFTPAPLGSPPEVILLSLRNNGHLPAVLDFRFTHAHEFDVEPWAEVAAPSTSAVQVAELVARRVVDVQPRRAALQPGESVTIRLHYAYVTSLNGGRHDVAVILRLAQGKQVRLLLRGRTLNPAFPHLYLGLPRGVHRLAAVPLACAEVPFQPVLLRNPSAVALAFTLDPASLQDLAADNYGFPVFTAVAVDPATARAAARAKAVTAGTPPGADAATLLELDTALHRGIIPAGGHTTIWVRFQPLEAVEYRSRLRIAYSFAALQDEEWAAAAADAVQRTADAEAEAAESGMFGEGAGASTPSASATVSALQRAMLSHAAQVDEGGQLGLFPFATSREQLPLYETALHESLGLRHDNGGEVVLHLAGEGFVPPPPHATPTPTSLRVHPLPAVVSSTVRCGAQVGAGAECALEGGRFVTGMEDGGDEGVEEVEGGPDADSGAQARRAAAAHAQQGMRVLAAHAAGLTAGSTADLDAAGRTPRQASARSGEGGASAELALPPSTALVPARRFKPRPGEVPAKHFGALPPPRRFVRLPAPWLGEAAARLSAEWLRLGDVPAGHCVHRILVLYNCRNTPELTAAAAADRAARAQALGVEAARAAGNGSAAAARLSHGGGASAMGTTRAKGETAVSGHVRVTNAATAAVLRGSGGGPSPATVGVASRNIGTGQGPLLFAWDAAHPLLQHGTLRIHPMRGEVPAGGHAVVRVSLHAPAQPQTVDTDVALLVGVTHGEMMQGTRHVAAQAAQAQRKVTAGAGGLPDPVHVPVALKSTLSRDARIGADKAPPSALQGGGGGATQRTKSHGGATGRSTMSSVALDPAGSSAVLAQGQLVLASTSGEGGMTPPAFPAPGVGTVSAAIPLAGAPAVPTRALSSARLLARAAAQEAASADDASHRVQVPPPASQRGGVSRGTPSTSGGGLRHVSAVPPVGRLYLHVTARVAAEDEFVACHGTAALAAFGQAAGQGTTSDRPLLPSPDTGAGAPDSPPAPVSARADGAVVGDVLADLLAEVVGTAGVSSALQGLRAEATPTFRDIAKTTAGADAAAALRPAGDPASAPFARAWVLGSPEVQELAGRLVETTLLNLLREAVAGDFDVTSQPLALHQVL